MEEAGEPCGVEYYVRGVVQVTKHVVCVCGVVQVTKNVRGVARVPKNPNPPIHFQDATDKGGKRSSVNLSVSALALSCSLAQCSPNQTLAGEEDPVCTDQTRAATFNYSQERLHVLTRCWSLSFYISDTDSATHGSRVLTQDSKLGDLVRFS